MSDNYALAAFKKAKRWPFGQRLYSAYGARQAPYFKSIAPYVSILELNRCEILIRKRKRVENHIGTMHAIAIANGLEMAMGFMAEASIPKHLRWIPKSMQIDYDSKATTDIVCKASVANDAWQVGDMSIPVEAVDTNGVVVTKGTILLWISEKPAKSV